MRATRGFGAAVLIAAAATVLVSCRTLPLPSPLPPQTLSPATGCHVGVLGDSLTMSVQPLMPAALEAEDCEQVWTDGSIGRTIAQGVDVLVRRQADGELPAVLVVGLGTNDEHRTAEFARHVDRVMEIMAGRPVVWIELAHDPVKVELNAVLRRKAAHYANLTIMDWDRAYWTHDEWRASDSVHLTAEGADERARAIAQAAGRVAK
jgi:lysophospholipase L1-like esterase